MSITEKITIALQIMLIAIIILVTFVSVSKAQDLRCGTRAFIVKNLASKYKEVSHSVALANKGRWLIETFLSSGGTWTILRTETTGRTCIMFSGTNWYNNRKKQGKIS